MSRNPDEIAGQIMVACAERQPMGDLLLELRATERRLTVEKVREAARQKWDERRGRLTLAGFFAILDDLATAAVDEEERIAWKPEHKTVRGPTRSRADREADFNRFLHPKEPQP